MATTNATIALASDITDSSLSVSNTTALNTAGTSTGVNTLTSVTKVLSSTDHVDLITTGSVSTTHAYVYINNPSTDESQYFHIHIGNAVGSGTYDDGTLPTEEIGTLYAGDWMWFPWDVDDDITIKPSTSDDMTVEYMVFS
tara:strand:+ start:912 stop:1334 length:423 start_codon:yes stop_codon:yes gene_type:complete